MHHNVDHIIFYERIKFLSLYRLYKFNVKKLIKLDNANSIKCIMRHSTGNDVTSNTYTHKDLEQLRKAIEKIK